MGHEASTNSDILEIRGHSAIRGPLVCQGGDGAIAGSGIREMRELVLHG